MHDQVGVSLRSTYDLLTNCSGGRDKVGCTRRDLQNHRDLVRRTPLKAGEGRWLYDYFMGVKDKDPTFFYKVKKDENCQIESVFWANGRMVTDYHYFGDAISFDTTYRTNDHFRPLGVFSAFNQHRMLIVLEAALLFEEIAESFEWLFKTLLECMRDKCPRSIFTDQCPAIGAAWVNKNFTCGMRYSQLSESLNSSLRTNLDTKTNLPTFFGELSRMLEKKRDDELYQDYLATNRNVTNFFPKNSLVIQASEFYSPKIFTYFQEEYANSMDLIMKGGIPVITQGVNNTFSWFKYSMEEETFDTDEHTVTFKLDTWCYDCSCDKFDSSGWLCRHIMKTMDQISSFGINDAWTIPKDYLLDRWSTNAKIGGAIHGSTVECLDMET